MEYKFNKEQTNQKNRINTRENTFKCKICSEEYSSHGNLQRHLNSDHVHKGLTFKCKVCSKEYSSSGNLKRHLNSDNVHKGRTLH